MKNKNIISSVFLFLGIISLFFTIFLNGDYFNIPLFDGKYSDIRLNAEDTGKNFKVFINDFEIHPSRQPDLNSFKTFEINNFPVYSIKTEGELKKAVLTVGDKFFYYTKNDIESFEKDGEKAVFPKNVKYFENSKFITDKGVLYNFFTAFLSIFYNPHFYILPFLCFLLAYFTYKNKEDEKSEKNTGGIILFILILGALLRAAEISSSFWSDETYAAYYAGNPSLPWTSVFYDPGNPPLFFIMSKIWISLFGYEPYSTRLLTVIFSLASIYLIYYLSGKTKAGVFASFLFSVNIYSIITAQEFRCYSFAIFSVLLISIVFFNLLKNPNRKNFISYFVLAVLMFNVHYYLTFILASLFILGMIFLKEKRLNFLFVNILSFLSFLPFLIITGLNKGLYNDGFNNFNFPDFAFYLDVIQKFQGKIIPFIILLSALLFLIKPVKEKILKDDKLLNLFFYSLYLIISVFIFTFLFSYIKPLTRDWYFVVLLPFFIIVFSILPFLSYKNKYIGKILIPIILISFFIPSDNLIKRQRARLLNFDNIVSYYVSDKNENSRLIIPHSKEMLPVCYKDKLKEEELIVLDSPQTKDKITSLIENSSGSDFYLKLDYYMLGDFVNYLSKKYKTSFIRIDKDVIIAKIEKRNKK